MDGQSWAQEQQAVAEPHNLIPDDIAVKIRKVINRLHGITQVIGTHHSTNTDLALLNERLMVIDGHVLKIDTYLREMEKITARIVTTGPGE